jgi:hypothetical protein
MKETIQYYMNRGSDVFASLLDASKAFDRIRFDVLFETLIKRGVRWPDLRMLLHLYTYQRSRTAWGGSFSPYFSLENGIRQGSIASPILFCVYMDDLISRLRDGDDGCWMGHKYFGVLMYADDITMLSPSVSGLGG